MADFETKLRWLSERGNLVGAEELIERIEADLAGDPLVVVAKRREVTLMTKTQRSPTTRPPSRLKGPAWAVTAFVAILVGAVGLYLAFPSDRDEVADTPTPPTTVAPDVETMTDLEVIEAGVAAFYSGDGERAADLFELPDRTDEEIRQEAAYQAAVDGRLGLDCTEGTPGTFRCTMEYRNALTDAAAAFAEDVGLVWDVWGEGGVEVVVVDGVITAFVYPENAIVNIALGSFLATEGRLGGYEDCVFGPFTESCAVIQLENLDAWGEWLEALRSATGELKPGTVSLVNSALRAWYGGDCLAAHYLGGAMLYVDGVMGDNGYRDGADALCPSSASSSQTIEYESILGAEVTVEACEYTGSGFDWFREFDNLAVYLFHGGLTCNVHYSNAMNTAVGKSPSVTVRDDFLVSHLGLVMALHPDDLAFTGGSRQPRFLPWYVQGLYPEDTELREAFRVFADGGELQDDYAAANCANARTPDCAQLIMDNLDDWAAWYETNS